MKNKILFIPIFALLFANCNNKKIDEHAAHDHGKPKIQYAAYSDDFEVFAEADPFVYGKESKIIAHFSSIPDFKALENANITVRLIVKGREINQTITEPLRKGIYVFKIKPEAIGKGKLVFDIDSEKGNFKVVASDITVYKSKGEAKKAGKQTFPETNTLVFTKEQSWKIDFATDLPKSGTFGQFIKTTAFVESAHEDESIVSAVSSGTIVHTNELIVEGKSVKKGQILFTIAGSGLADKNSATQFQKAQNNLEKTKTDYERSKELAKDKIISEKDLLAAKTDYENAKANYDNLRKSFTSSGQNIISPLDGFIKHLHVKNGQYVNEGQTIVLISKNNSLSLHADVQQKYSSVLGNIVSANIRTLHNNKTYSLEDLNGQIVSYGKTTNNDNFLIPIHIHIHNNGSFVSGGFVELFLKTQSNQEAMLIPNTALLEEQGNYFVFVQITPELFEKREVKIGVNDGFKTEIISGLLKTERVVTKGAMLVKLSEASGALDPHAGHVH